MKQTFMAVAILAAVVMALPVTADDTVQVTKFTMKDIDGKDTPLKKYEGKVLLVVNVASKCGLTLQYKDLVMLHEKYQAKGFEVLGFPANNFMGQEPGTNEEIKTFCATEYGVEFPIFSKISVKGDDIDPFYADLTSKEKNGEFSGDIKWNFTKFLVGRDGKVIDRFEPQTKPSADEVVKAIEAAIGD